MRKGNEQQVDSKTSSEINTVLVMGRHSSRRSSREIVAQVSSVEVATCLALCLVAPASLVVSVERKLIMSPDSDEL